MMARLLFFLLLCVVFPELPAQSKVPLKDKNSYLRLELNGIPERIICKAEKQESYSTHYAGWYGAEKNFVLVLNFRTPLTEQWSDVTFTFVPNRSGRIWLRIGGRWSKYNEERNWLMIASVKRNGKLLPNGDFKKYREKTPEEYRPQNWILSHRAQYYLDAGDNKTPVCVINHDSPITTSFDVRAGEPNTITIRVKVPKKRLIPKVPATKRPVRR